MCNCSDCGWKHGCNPNMVAKILVVIGGINWGLVGAGMLLGADWNFVHMALASWPKVEAVVYILVGMSALFRLVGCRCKKCMSGTCGTSMPPNPPAQM